MNIENRMQDFEKVSKKQQGTEDVPRRMEEFDKVMVDKKHLSHDKTSSLPYGFKRHKPCPHCGEFMEIQEVNEKSASYFCKSCNKASEIKV